MYLHTYLHTYLPTYASTTASSFLTYLSTKLDKKTRAHPAYLHILLLLVDVPFLQQHMSDDDDDDEVATVLRILGLLPSIISLATMLML